MAVNPKDIFKVMKAKETFDRNHPKFGPFLQAAHGAVQEGSVIEISVTPPDGKPIVTNLRVQASDMELLCELMEMSQKS